VNYAQKRDAQAFFDDLGRAVQANPVPAALIGMGALWMLMGGGRTTAAAALLSGGASRVADTLSPAASAVGSGASRFASGVSGLASSATNMAGQAFQSASDATTQAFQSASDATTDAAKRVSSAVSGAGSRAGDQVGSMSDSVSGSVSSMAGSVSNGATALAGSVQSSLAETFERQPLLVGIAGLAIGAAIASAFSKTRFEEEMIGEQAGAMKEKAETFFSEAAENLGTRATRAVDAMRQEADTQGLTPSGLKETAAAIGKKAATAARSTCTGSGAGTRRNGPQSPN
jgi:hypothetical protein